LGATFNEINELMKEQGELRDLLVDTKSTNMLLTSQMQELEGKIEELQNVKKVDEEKRELEHSERQKVHLRFVY
jgi:hypothetical protein